MLMFKVGELPELPKGKGNKVISIPSSRVVDRTEFVIAYAVISVDQVLMIHSGKRYLRMTMDDMEHYRGERGRRGNKLPRGFQKVDRVEVQEK
jgi:topoisomerase-4 subunit A